MWRSNHSRETLLKDQYFEVLLGISICVRNARNLRAWERFAIAITLLSSLRKYLMQHSLLARVLLFSSIDTVKFTSRTSTIHVCI